MEPKESCRKATPVAHFPDEWENNDRPSAEPSGSSRSQSPVDELLALHKETCAAAHETMRRKNHDYTSGSQNVFANFEGSEFLGVHPMIGMMVRMMDKLKRVQTFVEQGTLQVQGEGVDDSIEDLINYSILLKAMAIHYSRP